MCPKWHKVALDPFGDHLVCCRQNNFTAPHGALQDAVLLVLGLAKQPAEREQALQKAKSSSDPPAVATGGHSPARLGRGP